MATKPSVDLEWGNSGIAPLKSKKTTGYVENEYLPRQWTNWFYKTQTEWKDYLEEATDYIYTGAASRTINSTTELFAIATELSNKILLYDVTVNISAACGSSVFNPFIFRNISGAQFILEMGASSSYFWGYFDNITNLRINNSNWGNNTTPQDYWLRIKDCNTFYLDVDSCYSYDTFALIENSKGIIISVIYEDEFAGRLFSENSIVCDNSEVVLWNSYRASGSASIPSGAYSIEGKNGSTITVRNGGSFVKNVAAKAAIVDASSIGISETSNIIINGDF